MARRFAKVSEEEIKTKFFYPSDLVNTNITSCCGMQVHFNQNSISNRY